MDLQHLLNNLNQLPQLVQSAAPLLGGGALASVVVQGVKHKLSLESDKVLMVLLFATSFIEVAVNYLNSQASANPSLLGTNTAAVVGIATAVYRLGTKPLYNILLDAKTQRASNTTTGNTSLNFLAPANAVSTPAPVETPAVFEG